MSGYVDGDSLLVRIRVAWGADVYADPDTWEWTDITEWWHVPTEVTIGWGRSSGAEEAETSTLSLGLKNSDGRFTSGYAMSPYWPHVQPWTPIEFDVDLSDGEGWRNRYSGYVNSWPVAWPGGSSRYSVVTIAAVGELGKAGRGTPPAVSPMRRTLTHLAAAYWPMEDGDGATIAGSALAGHQPLTIKGGALAFADVGSALTAQTWRYGTDRIADLSGGARLYASVPPDVTLATGTAQGWSAMIGAELGNNMAAYSGAVVLLEVDTPGGTYARWRLQANPHLVGPDFGMKIYGITADGTATEMTSDSIAGNFLTFNISVWQDGANIRIGYQWRGPTAQWVTTVTAPGTVAGVTGVGTNTLGATSSEILPMGHLALFAGQPYTLRDTRQDGFPEWPGGHRGARDSYYYETAHERLARLLAEDGVRISLPALPAGQATPRMGWQPIGQSLPLWRECEAADGGLIYESGFAVAYVPRVLRYNPDVALTLDGAIGQIGDDLNLKADAQRLRNVVTVSREGGASAVAADLDLVRTQGRIPTSPTLNLASDDALPSRASWLLRLSTAREPRCDTLSVNLSSHRGLAAAWCDVRPGARVQVLNPPPQAGGLDDQLVVGAVETLQGRRSWNVVLNVEPASPWLVGAADGVHRVDTDGSRIAASAPPWATELLVAASAGAGLPWTSDPAALPLPLLARGEPVLATAVAPFGTDAFVRSSASTWTTGPVGAWTHGGGAATDYQVSAGDATVRIDAVGSSRRCLLPHVWTDMDAEITVVVPVQAVGESISAGWMLRHQDASNYLQVELEFISLAEHADSRIEVRAVERLAGVGQVYRQVVMAVGWTPGTPIRVRGQVAGNRLRGMAWPAAGPRPRGWMYDEPVTTLLGPGRLGLRSQLDTGNTNTLPVTVTYRDLVVHQPQRLTVTRTLPILAQPAGAPVRLLRPARVAL
ncbi:hypothetical protein E0H26_11760 [Micromonospora zingiberis]|uniref:Uncharacterized protein n=1 Tax=Micromonospora zingiberis TaxID=2053011 RepID=A0A4R0GK03_9ACTN|nr:hypothetical protein [Micromonospora zingiberis]TCB97586.1 hypothetical protein E0H26_11760 [Micromonospora zingiberis]